MKVAEWKNEYIGIVRWALSRMQPDTLAFYEDKLDDWVDTLTALYNFERDLFDRHLSKKNESRFRIRSREWYLLCHKYIRYAKREKNKVMAEFFFTIWQDLRSCFKSYNSLVTAQDHMRFISEEELNYAKNNLVPPLTEEQKELHLETRFYSYRSRVLTYRNINATVDNIWGCAHINYKKKHRQFDLIWDWYYPIDVFLDLEKGWR